LTLVLGQLIDQSYSDKLAEEINDRVQEQGQLTIAELTKQYDLPAEFLREVCKYLIIADTPGVSATQEPGSYAPEIII
jgi:hypothetical protein